MRTSDFDYELPRELIAQRPLPRRDQSRMMVLRRHEAEIIHSRFRELPGFLPERSVLVLNDTKVIPARIWGRAKEAEVEFLFLGERKPGLWDILCRPAKKVRIGDRIAFPGRLWATVAGMGERGMRTLDFGPVDIRKTLAKSGFAPLPPYIKRPKSLSALRSFDLRRYQTVFARNEGSIAAPTAGLHFTPRILEEIEKRGVEVVPITLEVGLATFEPVRSERVEEHPMRQERLMIGLEAAGKINRAKAEGRPVVAVGTTVVRALESAWLEGALRPGERWTSLFISPGYRFRAVDALLTNFHLPRSTLLMLVSAFAGSGLIKKAYAEAVRERYRFYSYGDCMLIL